MHKNVFKTLQSRNNTKTRKGIKRNRKKNSLNVIKERQVENWIAVCYEARNYKYHCLLRLHHCNYKAVASEKKKNIQKR